MDIYHVGTSLIPLDSWKGAEHCPIDRIRIGRLVVAESDIVSKSARKINSLNIYRIGTYLIPLGSWEGAGHYPIDRIAIDGLAWAESYFEYWYHLELAWLLRHFLF